MKILNIVLIFIFSIVWTQSLYAKQIDSSPNFQEIEISPKVGLPFKATIFPADSKRIAVFVPGSAFKKESWYELAEKLQQKGIAAISLDARSYSSIKNTLMYLHDNKYEKFSLIGASIGGGSVTDIASAEDTKGIIKIVALAPYGGSSIKNEKIDKLFIIANEDNFGIYNSVLKQFQNSSKPKEFYSIESKMHAQHLFKTKHKDIIQQKMIDFILDVK